MMPLSWFKDNKHLICTSCNYEFAIDFEKLPGVKAVLDKL
jgi:hypothetical protein